MPQLEMPIKIRILGIPKLSEYRFGIRMDNSYFFRTRSDKHSNLVTFFEKPLVNFLYIYLFYNVLCYLLSQQNMTEVLYHYGDILGMNHIIPIGNVQTIFRHIPTSESFWTESYLASRTSDGLGRIFF